MLKLINEDRSTNPKDITMICEGFLDAEKILKLPGESNEHVLFESCEYGRMSKHEFENLSADIKKNGMQYPVTIFVYADGKAFINEGNHRLRASVYAGISSIYTEIRYFGNSQDVRKIE